MISIRDIISCTSNVNHRMTMGFMNTEPSRGRVVVGFITTYAISAYHRKVVRAPFMARCTRYNIML